MFRESVTSTVFTSEAADELFKNITGEPFGGDCSFLSTLRALLGPRVPAEDRVRLVFNHSSLSASSVADEPPEDIFDSILDGGGVTECSGVLYVHSLNGLQDDNKAVMSVIYDHFTEVYPKFRRLDKVIALFRPSFPLYCFVSDELKTVILFVDRLDNRKLHYIQCAALPLFPWYFDGKVSPQELELMKTFRGDSIAEYTRVLTELSAAYDFRSARVRKLLFGFETRRSKAELQAVTSEIGDCDRKLDQLNNQFGSYIQMRNDLCVRRLGLERVIAEGGAESALMDYFLGNRSLYLRDVSDSQITFAVKDYLTYFDRELADSVIRNARSDAYSYLPSGISKPQAKKLLTEIFVSDSPRLRVKTCAVYRLDLNGSANGVSGATYGPEFADAIPNMHIERYACLGGYHTVINGFLKKRDYIGAVEQCAASAKNLSFSDGAVMGHFFPAFFKGDGYNNRCVELPDGSVVTPTEAVKWLESQEKEEGEKTDE